MANKMTDPKKGVGVKITGKNSIKILKVIKETRRTFANEVNIGVEEYADKKLVAHKDNSR